MTTSFVTVVHCDYPGCGRQDQQRDGKTMPDGWVSAIYTHGCPDHGDVIVHHKADVRCDTRRRKDYWFLTCACGWAPACRWEMASTRILKREHLAHIAATVGVST